MNTTILTAGQEAKLRVLCDRFNVEFKPEHYTPAFDLPDGWVNGWIGGPEHAGTRWGDGTFHGGTIFVGVSPEGDSHS